jgi:preprotein translocase subunit YajC
MKQFIALLSLLLVGGQAFADPAGASPMGSGAMSQILLLVAFMAIFYFMILRPQSKRAKDHQQLVGGLQKGDEIITTGGLLGRIKEVNDNFFVVVLSEGIEVFVQRQAVTTSVPKGTMKSLS